MHLLRAIHPVKNLLGGAENTFSIHNIVNIRISNYTCAAAKNITN